MDIMCCMFHPRSNPVCSYFLLQCACTFMANLCILIFIVANEEGDPLCCRLFYDAGIMLGKMVVALKPKVHKVTKNIDLRTSINIKHMLFSIKGKIIIIKDK